MPEAAPAADTGRSAAVAAPTGDVVQPQWRDLFLEPDLPPAPDDE
jgi:hypothetical protein